MPESNEQRVERILVKLKQVQHKGLSCFGSDSHMFRLNPPIDERALVNFETEHGISLPVDYRCFLRTAGNGGAGPYYGIYKLAQWKDFVDWTTDDPPESILALPCPLHPKMTRDTDWESQFGDCISPYQGVISIGSQGCTYAMGLIVTGEYAGRVVYLDADGQAPYVVREPDFLSWYERWLDELLGGYDMFWFGYGLGGDEASLTALLGDPATSDSDRAEALYAIRRLPHLSSHGQQQVCHLASDSVAEVRTAACAVVEKFGISAAKNSVAMLLHDESPEVQRAAIGASTKLNWSAVREDVTRLLDSEHEEVAKGAFFTLKDNGNLPRETLLRLAESSPHGVIRYLAAHAAEWKTEDEALLIRLLHDEHPQVRFYAILGLRQISARSSLSEVIELLNDETDDHTIDAILRMLGEVPGDKNADVLLEWAEKGDDYYRLSAVDSLCKLGDVRVAPIAESLLSETRSPERVDSSGLSVMSNIRSIRELVLKSLRASPNRQLRRLGSRFQWPQWLRVGKSASESEP